MPRKAHNMKKIVVFASGSGTNAQNLIEYFNKTVEKKVTLVLSNKPDAKVLERAGKLGVENMSFTREDLNENGRVKAILEVAAPDLIVLAGFLWLFPSDILREYEDKVVNIHPALLPSYGGKGMFGMKVHEAVIENKESQSGITIHLVNEEYDRGHILFQAVCEIEEGDSPGMLAQKIHALEYEHFPKVLDKLMDEAD